MPSVQKLLLCVALVRIAILSYTIHLVTNPLIRSSRFVSADHLRTAGARARSSLVGQNNTMHTTEFS